MNARNESPKGDAMDEMLAPLADADSGPGLLPEQRAAILLEARRATPAPERAPRGVARRFLRLAAGLATAAGIVFALMLARGPSSHVDMMDPAIAKSSLYPMDSARVDSYAPVREVGFARALFEPRSTFGADVDTAGYAILRRMLNEGTLPPPAWVRVEEMVNYFPYAYEGPTGPEPFAVRTEVAACPWNLEHRLVRVALKGREVAKSERPKMNLVFLVDVSGSMSEPDKLPLVQSSLRMVLEELTEWDRVAIVVYAGAAGVRLPSTSCRDKAAIRAAIDGLSAGGSTAGAEGIEAAYAEAAKGYIAGGVNRVVLATDGDFNVGVTSQADLLKLIEEKAKTGVFLSVLGYGMGNLKDDTLEMLADKGNGNYAYVDTEREARKALVEDLGAMLLTIAKDVKIQVEFNPSRVGAWRLLGYENRLMPTRDFRDDAKDGGEVGAGHAVTAFYEIVPPGKEGAVAPDEKPLRYGDATAPGVDSPETLSVSVRWKAPDAGTSQEIEVPLVDSGARYEDASPDFKFAAAVAAFGLVLRNSEYKGTATYEGVTELASEGLSSDPGGYRAEFVALVGKAKGIALAASPAPPAPPVASVAPVVPPAPPAPSTPLHRERHELPADCEPDPAHPARLVFEGLASGDVLDLGDLRQGVEIERPVTVRNAGEGDLCIADVQTGCGCVKVRWAGSMRLKPGESGTVNVKVDTKNREGTTRKDVTLWTNDPARREARFAVLLNVRLGVIAEGAVVLFGHHAVGNPGVATLRLKCPRSEPAWEVTGVEGTTVAYTFTASPVEPNDPEFRTVELKIRHPGLDHEDTFAEPLKIRTSNPDRPEIALPAQMVVTPKYYTGPARRVSFGPLKSGTGPVQRQVWVWAGEDDAKFSIRSARVEGEGYEVTQPTPGPNRGWVMVVRYDGKARPAGTTVEATLAIEVDDPGFETMKVLLSGVVGE